MFLGIDASTSAVGLSILDETGQIVTLQHLDIKGVDTVLLKVQTLLAHLNDLLDTHKGVRYVGIENYLKGYAGGRTNMDTIVMLAQMNILTQYILRRDFGHLLELKVIPVQTARRLAIGKMPTIKGSAFGSQKEFIFDWFCKTFMWDFPLTPRSKQPIEQARDQVDAWVIARSMYMAYEANTIDVLGEIKPKVKKKRKKKKA